jgi:hypothetical protein
MPAAKSPFFIPVFANKTNAHVRSYLSEDKRCYHISPSQPGIAPVAARLDRQHLRWLTLASADHRTREEG